MTKPIPQTYQNRLILALTILISLLGIGTAGYVTLERLTLVDALYMTVITLSTVGFGEVRELSQAGRVFTIILILGGGGVAAFSLSSAVEFIMSEQWRGYLNTRRRNRMLKELSNHVIVCGFGRVGRHVSGELTDEGLSFVVVDIDPDRVLHAERVGYLAMEGNAANETILQNAGIERARAVVVAVNSDAENVFIVLTARSLNPNVYIVARANYEDSEPKLLKAGANRTIQPYSISGKRMVTMLMRPNVADFLDEVAHAGGMELLLEQVQIQEGSPLANQTVQESQISNRLGITVLACRRKDGSFHTPPGPETVLDCGMSIIVMGTRENLNKLMEIAEG